MQRQWAKPAEIEAMDRQFNENTRYYNIFPEKRSCGLKFIPPPKQENIKQYHEAEEFAKSKAKMDNLLLSDNYSYKGRVRYSKNKRNDDINGDGVSVKSILSPESKKQKEYETI